MWTLISCQIGQTFIPDRSSYPLLVWLTINLDLFETVRTFTLANTTFDKSVDHVYLPDKWCQILEVKLGSYSRLQFQSTPLRFAIWCRCPTLRTATKLEGLRPCLGAWLTTNSEPYARKEVTVAVGPAIGNLGGLAEVWVGFSEHVSWTPGASFRNLPAWNWIREKNFFYLPAA